MIGVELLNVPVSARFDATVGDAQPVAGLELPHVTVRRRRREEVTEGQIALERRLVERPRPAGTALDRLDLAREVQRVAQDCVEQWLLAQPIARQEQLPPPAIVHSE